MKLKMPNDNSANRKCSLRFNLIVPSYDICYTDMKLGKNARVK